jgi:hypothetical protein
LKYLQPFAELRVHTFFSVSGITSKPFNAQEIEAASVTNIWEKDVGVEHPENASISGRMCSKPILVLFL